jgi:membrane protease YdiL (CAAX protease family)
MIQAKRIKLKGWLFILLIFPAVFTVSIGLDHALGGQLPGKTNLAGILTNPLSFFPLVLLSFMSGPFSEEIGWRGFALDPLLNRFGFARASIFLGVIWGVWHLPLYFMPQTWHGQMGFRLTGFWLFILMTIGLSCLMSYVYVRSQRSILSAMLMHLMSNFTAQLLAPVSPRTELIRGLLIFVMGLGACVYWSQTNQDVSAGYDLSNGTRAHEVLPETGGK